MFLGVFRVRLERVCVPRPRAGARPRPGPGRHGRRRSAAGGQAVSILTAASHRERAAHRGPPAFLRRGLFWSSRTHPRSVAKRSELVSRSRGADILSLVRRHGLRSVAPFQNGRIVREARRGHGPLAARAGRSPIAIWQRGDRA